MEGTMKTAVMTDIMEVEIQERPIPQPKDDEVLVKVEYVGICGSDLHYYESGRIGDFVVKPPFVLGHEAGGTVVEVGANVKNLKVGDRVAMEPGKTCGHCEFCKSGKYNLCEDVVFFATPPVDGVFQEYVAHEAGLCFKLPDNVSTLEGALIEPLAVGMHAARQGEAKLGQTAVVTGAGCIGLVSLLSLKAMGVTKVIVVDVMEKRLQKALELGADAVINGKEEDTVARIQELTGADLVEIEAADSYPSSYSAALSRAERELDQNARPAVTTAIEDMAQYDVVYVGYPIWYGYAPRPVLTFLETYDWSGKTVVPFCTSGSSGISASLGEIRVSCPGAYVTEGRRVNDVDSIEAWLNVIR